MTSLPTAELSSRTVDWLLPDRLTDPAAQFAVEWQVVEGVERFPVQPTAEGREFS